MRRNIFKSDEAYAQNVENVMTQKIAPELRKWENSWSKLRTFVSKFWEGNHSKSLWELKKWENIYSKLRETYSHCEKEFTQNDVESEWRWENMYSKFVTGLLLNSKIVY